MDENVIAKEIADAAFRIHTTLGPVLLESDYEAFLYLRLADKRLGLLTNFNRGTDQGRNHGIVNGLDEDSHAKPRKTPRNAKTDLERN